MKYKIAIISSNILFYNLFAPLIKIKFAEVEVLICKTYTEIDENIQDSKIDLFLLDSKIIGSSSLDVINQLRTSLLSKAPVWFFPKINTTSYAQSAQVMGANKIINRPFDPYFVIEDALTLLTKPTV